MSKPPSVWLMRAGGHGEDEKTALAEGRAIIGFEDVGGHSLRWPLTSMAMPSSPMTGETRECRGFEH